jgi:hypothetical protein
MSLTEGKIISQISINQLVSVCAYFISKEWNSKILFICMNVMLGRAEGVAARIFRMSTDLQDMIHVKT